MSDEQGWYYAENGATVGPMSKSELIQRLPGVGGLDCMIYGPGMGEWAPARTVASVADGLAGGFHGQRPPALPPSRPAPRNSDEIDYEIFGEEMQYVEVTLDPREMVIAEAGLMMFMDPAIKMETVFGDPSGEQAKPGFMDKLMSAGKRVLTGESLFVTTFSNAGASRAVVAFAAPYPGKIVPLHLDQLGGEIICQKGSFVCAARGTKINIAFQKKIGVGLFGGEGFIMQRLNGDGIAMVHAGGTLMHRDLRPGETIRLDTGCLVALQPSVTYDIQLVGGVKNTLFGGEGLFLATVSGPGRVWFQSLPFSRLAGRLIGAASGKSRDEGSVLGGLGLGALLGSSE